MTNIGKSSSYKCRPLLSKIYTLLYIIGLTAVTGSTICSCDHRQAYEHYEHLRLSGWERNDTVQFGFPCKADGTYDMSIGLRANKDFPYQSISMIMECTVYHPSKVVRKTKNATINLPAAMTKDTIECGIIDKRGLLMGKRGISYSEITYPLKDISLRKGDSLHIKISHCMSRESVPGLADVGVSAYRR